MTVDHILFNNQSWYSVAKNADNVKANGKEYMALPVRFTIPKGTHLSDGIHEQGFDLSKDCNVTCVGASDEFYYFCGDLVFTQDYGGDFVNTWDVDNPKDVYDVRDSFHPPMFVKKDIVKNIIW